MTKTTIYLARIIKLMDYGMDLTVAMEAFDSLEKARAFMEAEDMVELRYGWVSPTNSDYEGFIEPLEVK